MRKHANYTIGLLLGMLLAGPFMLAQQPLDLTIPSNAIAFHDRTTATGCDIGWTDMTSTVAGYYLTGLVSSGTRGTPAVASSGFTVDQEARTHTHTLNGHAHSMQSHTHTWSFTTSGPTATMLKRNLAIATVSTGAHTHTGSGTTPASATTNTGTSSVNTGNGSVTTILPYLQYLVCKKN